MAYRHQLSDVLNALSRLFHADYYTCRIPAARVKEAERILKQFVVGIDKDGSALLYMVDANLPEGPAPKSAPAPARMADDRELREQLDQLTAITAQQRTEIARLNKLLGNAPAEESKKERFELIEIYEDENE